MNNIQNIDGLVCLGKQKKKKQIILTHTSRNIKDYVSAIKHRYNGKYDKIPNFLIGRDGVVYRLIPENGYTNYFPNLNVNRNSIIISLENLGWLEKIPLTEHYVNWNGDIYKEQVFEKKWRDYFFWQPRFEGIVSKSNFDSDYTDLSPAFNFENFLKQLEDEQFI